MATNFDKNGTYNLGGQLATSVQAQRDSGTPAGTFPAITFDVTGALGSFNITSRAGAHTTVNLNVSLMNAVDLFVDGAGSTLTLKAGISVFSAVDATVTNGGSFIIGASCIGLLDNATITYGPGGGTVVLTGQCGLLDIGEAPEFGGFATGGGSNIIDDQALQFSTLSGYSVTRTCLGESITIDSGRGSFSFIIQDTSLATGHYAIGAGPLHFKNDGVGGTTFSVCFLEGTHIATPGGERRIEALREGDLVTVLQDGAAVNRPVRWIGSRAMDAAEFAYRTEAFPVRIRADAFAVGVPHRDLLVTPEHCILVEDRLIPARMLVNNRSIIVDRAIACYRYFHIELEAHGILLAEGLTAESYLDTGNRAIFTGGEAHARSGSDALLAAPLATARDVVEPIWNHLNRRATILGFDAASAMPALTDDPDLRLLLDDGTRIAARWHNTVRQMFHIPRGARPVRLLSRASSPAEIHGPFVDDRRRLGIAVEKLVLWQGLTDTVIGAGDLVLPGWHGPEQGGSWTDGAAELDLPRAECSDMFVDVHVAATMRYPMTERAQADGSTVASLADAPR